MVEIVVAQRMWQRRDTLEAWETVNPILADGEIGFERDVPLTYVKMKVGDGSTPWLTLPYFASGGGSIDMRVSGGYIQYSNDGGTTWADVIAVSDLEGADGRSAYEVALDNGFVGTESDWLLSLDGTDGSNGLSTYQIALNNGFVGTEAEWLLSLKGADGADAVGAASRAVVAFGEGTGTLAIGKSALLLHLETTAAARVRLYSTAAARAADVARPATAAPPQGSGLCLEFLSTGALLGAPLTPGVIAYNLDTTPTGVVYYNVQPAGGSSAVSLTYLKLES